MEQNPLNSLNSANSENPLKHELRDQFNCLLCQLCLWHSGRVPVSHTGDSGFESSNLFKIILFLSLNLLNSLKTFRENSNEAENTSYLATQPSIVKETRRLWSGLKVVHPFSNPQKIN